MKEDRDLGFATRLREAIGGQSVRGFAAANGLCLTQINKYLTGTKPGLDMLVTLARATGESVQWLATGQDRDATEFAQLPLRELRDEGGNGCQLVESQSSCALSIRFNLRQLSEKFKVPQDSLFVLRMDGDGMSPTIPGGSMMLCTDFHHLVDGLLHIIEVKGEVMVRELRKTSPGKVTALAHGKGYSSFKFDISSSELRVHGIVLMVTRIL